MTTSLELQSLKNISVHKSITRIESLGGRFPAQCLLLHDRSIRGKVYTKKLDVVDETIVFDVDTVDAEINTVKTGKAFLLTLTELINHHCKFDYVFRFDNPLFR